MSNLPHTEEMNKEFKQSEEWANNDHKRSEDWLTENFTFIENHIDDNASLDSCMFETYGEELEHVLNENEAHVWTYQDDDNGNPCITSGYHVVNRIGYLISEEPVEEGRTIYVKLENGEAVEKFK